jgi:HSP20 family protein
MLATRLFPWVNDLQVQVNRLLDDFRRAPGTTPGYPPLNVWEDKDNIFVEAELPGLNRERLEISVAEGKLIIQGERQAPEIAGGVWRLRERAYGQFHRACVLPVEVQADKVEATFEHGVLRVTLPKSERVKPRRIEVKTA